MISNDRLLEGLYGLGVPVETLNSVDKNLSPDAFRRQLLDKGIQLVDFDRAEAVVNLRTSNTGTLTTKVRQVLTAMGATPEGITQAEREIGGNSDPRAVLGVLSNIFGPERAGNIMIKVTGVKPPEGTIWNPYRGDNPPAGVDTKYGSRGNVAGQSGPAPLAGDVRAVDRSNAQPRPTEPLKEPAPTTGGALGGSRGGTLGGSLGGTTTAAQQSAGLRNLPRLSPNAGAAEVEAYIRKHYGYSAWALDVPELRSLMIELGKEFAGAEVSELTIEGRLSSTEWWKTHSDQQRLAIEEKMGDPATYNAKLEAKYRELAVITGQSGFSIDEPRLREIARTSYDMGWNQAEMRSALSAEFDYDPETGDEDQSRIVSDLRSLASEYLVPLGEQTIDQWGRQIIAGTSTNEDFTAYAKGMAKGMFAHYATDIDAGRTVRQIADPFIQTAAKDLELTADQINLMDPKWRKALELDPETGQPMQLSKWQRTIRTDSSYGWDLTQNARGEAAEFAKKIAESFGKM